MDPAQGMQLIDAINAGLYEYFQEADDQYRRTTATELILAPESKTITVTKHSEVTTGAPFLESERGKSVLIDGDPHLNEIVATNQLLRPYRGDSGTKPGTVYSDAVNIRNFQVERIVTDPFIADTGEPIKNAHSDLVYNKRLNQVFHSLSSLPTGDPCRYSNFHVGGSIATGGDDSVMILKLDPIPVRELTIQFDILIRAVSLGIETLRDPVLLPIDSTVFAKQFLPLIEEHLTSSSMWIADERMTARIIEKAEQAKESIRNLTHVLSRPKRRVGTKRGF